MVSKIEIRPKKQFPKILEKCILEYKIRAKSLLLDDKNECNGVSVFALRCVFAEFLHYSPPMHQFKMSMCASQYKEYFFKYYY